MGRVALLLGLLLAPPALAADGVLVLPAGSEAAAPEARARIQDALLEIGVTRIGFTTPEELERGIGMISVNTRAEDDSCGGLIEMADWSRRLSVAEKSFADEALAGFSLLDVEAPCLDEIPSPELLQRVQIGLLRVHLELAQAPGADYNFHRGQAEAAAQNLWMVSGDRPLPAGLEPGLVTFAEAHPAPAPTGSAVGAGPSGTVYLDGVPLGSTPVARSPGNHLVQIKTGGAVTAADLLYLPPGDVVIWAGLLVPGELRAEVEALASAGVPAPLLSAVEGLSGARIAVAALTPAEILLYRPDGTTFTDRARQSSISGVTPGLNPEPIREPRVRPLGTWSWLVGAGGVAGFGDFTDEPVDWLGASAGVSLWARGGLRGDWTWSATLHPQAKSELLPENYDAHYLWRAHIPLRIGARFGPPRLGISGDIGPELMVVALGPYEDKARFRAGAALAGGGSFPLVEGYRARLEGWLGGGPQAWYSAGASAGIERVW